jgi:hypothetical protein
VINSGSQTPRISIYTGSETTPGSDLKNVIIIANFSVSSQNVNPNFPYTGTWYNLMDNSTINVANTSDVIPLGAGQFRIFGNKPATLSTNTIKATTELILYPNPVKDTFSVNKKIEALTIHDITGKVVKSFKGNFGENHEFSISNLPASLYIVKITNDAKEENTLKIIKLN